MKGNPVTYVLRLGLTLLVITAVVAALLGGVNAITEDKIATIKQEKSNAAMAQEIGRASCRERV